MEFKFYAVVEERFEGDFGDLILHGVYVTYLEAEKAAKEKIDYFLQNPKNELTSRTVNILPSRAEVEIPSNAYDLPFTKELVDPVESRFEEE